MTTATAPAEIGTNASAIPGQVIILPPPTAPLDVAKCFVVRECVAGDALTLHYWRGGWWSWHETHWTEVASDVVEDRLYAFAARAVYRKPGKKGETVPWLPIRRKIGDVVAALRGVVRLDDAMQAPSWLDGRETGPLVACSNGLLDIRTRELEPHTPLYFNMTSVPFGPLRSSSV